MKDFLNLLEPENLVHAFLDAPPEGFVPITINGNAKPLPGFITRLDLSVAADKTAKKLLNKMRWLLPKPRTLFIGTTVSEYALFPAGVEPGKLKEQVLSKLHELGFPFLIIKDIPQESPILSNEENTFSKQLISHLKENDFLIVSGQALAYVPIDFPSVDAYLERFSKSRRKDFRRKLRSLDKITIDRISTGDGFSNDSLVETLYALYLNVFNKSEIHFDKLSFPFFKKVLQDKQNGGIVFLYRHQDAIIGFNICFFVKGYLVDKYIGFHYPEAQQFNLYFLSWFYNLSFCIEHNLKVFIAGWTDPEIKAYLGANFTSTYHAVYIKNPLVRFLMNKVKFLFEPDKKMLEKMLEKMEV